MALLALGVLIQIALVGLHGIAIAWLQPDQAWVDGPARLTIGFAAASAVAAVGLAMRRPWAPYLGMATPLQTILPFAGDQTAAIFGMIVLAINFVVLAPVFTLMSPRYVGLDVAGAVICVAGFALAAIDSGPFPPTERLRPSGVAAWPGTSADGRVQLPDGTLAPATELRIVSDLDAIDRFERGDLFFYGTDEAGRTWIAIYPVHDLADSDPEIELECRRVDGPAFREGDEFLVTLDPFRGVGIILEVAPGLDDDPDVSGRDRLLGSFCLDDEGRLRSHMPPARFGY